MVYARQVRSYLCLKIITLHSLWAQREIPRQIKSAYICVGVCVLALWVWDQINTFSEVDVSDVSACVEKVSQSNCDHTDTPVIWEQG